jgi:hypothetical protein
MEEPAKRRVWLTYFKEGVTVINQFIRTFATHKTIPKWGCPKLGHPHFSFLSFGIYIKSSNFD